MKFVQTNGALTGLYGSQIASTSASGDQLYASTLTQGISRDHDHRTSSPQYRSSPPQYRTSPPQYQDDRATPNEGRRGSASSGWMPQIHSVNDPRFSRRFVLCLFSTFTVHSCVIVSLCSWL